MHEGRPVGWGTSNQWRDAATHGITPKLVFTTSTNPEAGLKSFVLTDEWIILKAAGTRQQLNYTGINNPLRGRELAGPNNLGGEALEFFQGLLEREHNDEDFLLYLAAIYNSALADEYLQEGGGNVMHIPLASQHLDTDIVDAVILSGRRLRNLTWLSVEAEHDEPISEELAFSLASEEILRTNGFERAAGSGGRFRQNPAWRCGENTLDMLGRMRHEIQTDLDDGVRSLFDQLPRQ